MNRCCSGCRGWLFGGLIAISVAITFAHAAESPGAPTRIRVVADAHYPPFLFLDSNGKPQGYVADMWRLFQARTGIKVELLPVDWPEVQPDVLSGGADVVGMLYRTPARDALYDFSAPYAEQPVSIYVERRIRGVHDIATLRNYPVGVERGGVCAEKLAALGVQDLRMYADYEGVIAAAVHDDLRIFCMSEDSADYALYREAALDRFGKAFVLFTGEVHAAVRKGNAPMLAAVQQGLARITPAERAQLRKRWLDHSSVVSPYLRTAKLVLAVVAVLVALMALWVWMLRRSVARRTRELQEERNKLQMLFDASPDGMWVKDRDGVFRDANDRATELLRVERKRLMGSADEDLFDPEHAAQVRAMDEEVMRIGQPRTHLFHFPADDGATRHVEIVKAPLRTSGGAVRGVLSVARDITERLQAEEQLQAWAHAFQHAGFGVEICDLRTRRIIAVNPTFARERGYTPEEMAGMSLDVLYPDQQVAVQTANSGSDGRHEHVLAESEHVTRDGRRFPVLLDCSVSYDADGNPVRAIIYAQDITKRKHAESELRLAAAAFQTQDAMMVIGAEGTIQRVNKAFTQLTGYRDDEVLGQPPTMLSLERHGQIAPEELRDLAIRDGFWEGERWIRVKQGQPRIVRSMVSVVRDEQERVSCFVYAMTDLTSERAARASIDHMTFFDPLTDLPNRNLLHGRLQQVLDTADARSGALLLFDLDRFKRVNDLHGHAAGDRLLVLVTQRLRRQLGEHSLLSRFSGGTFALLEDGSGGDAQTWTERVDACVECIRQVSETLSTWVSVRP